MGKLRQLQIKHKPGKLLLVHAWINGIEVGHTLWFVASFRDITELKKYETALVRQKEITQKLLLNVIPPQVAEALEYSAKGKDRPLFANAYPIVTILFADIAQFTKMTSNISANELIHILNTLVSGWDKLCEKHGVEKIKTIGDCYLAVCGAPVMRIDHASRMLEFAIEMLSFLRDFNEQYDYDLKLRIGIHCGSIVTGVIGRSKMQFDIFGESVDITKKMESSGVEGRIHVSQEAYDRLKNDYFFEERGAQDIKGIGPVLTYLYKQKRFVKTDSGHKIRKSNLTPPTLRKKGSETLSPRKREGNSSTSDTASGHSSLARVPSIRAPPQDILSQSNSRSLSRQSSRLSSRLSSRQSVRQKIT